MKNSNQDKNSTNANANVKSTTNANKNSSTGSESFNDLKSAMNKVANTLNLNPHSNSNSNGSFFKQVPLVPKLVCLPGGVWGKLREQGFTIPIPDFNLNLFLIDVFKNTEMSEMVKIMDYSTRVSVMRELFLVMFSQKEIAHTVQILDKESSVFTERIKNLLIIAEESFKGPYEIDNVQYQLEFMEQESSDEKIVSTLEEETNPVKPKKATTSSTSKTKAKSTTTKSKSKKV